ncbi:ArnT family glycosyltransferase [Algibacter miyuki]|uniref:ArnT family glycosyltransferase n=1 Tax=Algibacter miyuki TaxID=1306933 RepID=A0ABV5H3T5_9FLAO|nr:glycosyltransferase family 39 protein [Algibacter miyuki]MDN3667656.1 glycosyltransferase family 39 protein [Algibacter miyuki]
MKKSSWTYLCFNPLFIGAFLCLVLLVLVLHPYIAYDEALWGYIGRAWTVNGLVPYLGTVENKTPGILILYAISEYFTTGNFIIERFIGALAVIFSSYYLYKICKRLHSEFAGIIAMCLFTLTSCWRVMDGFSLAQTETFMVFFSIISFYILIQENSKYTLNTRVFMAGVFLGLAISFKQIAITTSAAFFLFYFINLSEDKGVSKRVLGTLYFIIGIVIGVASLFLVMSFYGVSVQDYLSGAWYILLDSGSAAPDLKTRMLNFFRVFISSRFILFYLFLYLFKLQYIELKNKYIVGILIWLAFDFIGVNASGYYYGHQIKQIFAPIVILSAIGIASFVEKKKYFNYKDHVYIAVLVVLFFPYLQFKNIASAFVKGDVEPSRTLGAWLESETKESDYIYVLSNDQILIKALYFSKRRSSSQYFHSIFINSEQSNQVLSRELKEKPPVFLLKETLPALENTKYSTDVIAFIQNNYTLYKEESYYQIFKRN